MSLATSQPLQDASIYLIPITYVTWFAFWLVQKVPEYPTAPETVVVLPEEKEASEKQDEPRANGHAVDTLVVKQEPVRVVSNGRAPTALSFAN